MSESTTVAEPMMGDPEQDVVDPAVTDSGQRRSARPPRARTRRRGPRRRRRLIAAGVVGVALTGWLAYASPLTLVQHVVVVAPHGMSADELRLASGIAASDHVPAVEADTIRNAIMSAMPAVGDVQVVRSLPHTVRLVVTARTPVAAVVADTGYSLMDAEGVLYDKVAAPKGLPVVAARTEVGQQTARAVLLSLPEDLRAKVTRVSARTRDDVALTLRSGATVRWGSADDAALKASVLAGLMAVRADRYDVSAPLLPTTTGGDVGPSGS